MARWLTIKEAAAILDLTPDAVRKRAKRGQLQIRIQDGIQRVLVEDDRILSSTVGHATSEAQGALVEALRGQIAQLTEQNRQLFEQLQMVNDSDKLHTEIIRRFLVLTPGSAPMAPPAEAVETPTATVIQTPTAPIAEAKARPWWRRLWQ